MPSTEQDTRAWEGISLDYGWHQVHRCRTNREQPVGTWRRVFRIAAEVGATEPAGLGEHPEQPLGGVLEADDVQAGPKSGRNVRRLEELVALAEDAQRVPRTRIRHVVVGSLNVALAKDSDACVGGLAEGLVALVRRVYLPTGYGPSPMSGVGTSLALVGAYVLAGELAAAVGDHRAAFARYENEMREYVRQGQKLAKSNAVGLIPRTRSQIWIRNRMIRALSYLPWKGLIAGGVQKVANAITLKDYRGVYA